MIRAWTVCAAVTLALGCQSGEEPVRGVQQGVGTSAYQPPIEQPSEPVEIPELEPHELERIMVGTTTEETVERDLGSELAAALGSPTDCVRDYVASSATTIRISVGAIVRPTGMCIEPTAYGSGLSAAALECIRKRIGTVMLNPLDDTEQSEKVSTVLTLEYQPPVIIEADPGMPEPQLRNVRESLPKRPHVRLIDEGGHGIHIEDPFRGWLQGGDIKHPDGPKPKKVTGPKPRAIDGYEVDENAQEWR